MAVSLSVSEQGLVRLNDIVSPALDETITWWAYVTSSPPNDGGWATLLVIIDDPATYADYIWVGLNPTGVVLLDVAGTTDVGPSPVSVGWHKFAYRRTGDIHDVFMDDAQIATVTVDTAGFALSDIYLGTDTIGQNWDASIVAYFRQYSTALSNDQIASELISATPVSTAFLFATTPLESDLLDDSGNNRNWAESSPSGMTFVAQPTLIAVDSNVTVVTDFYSDHDMQCPPDWYGGFKQGRVMRFGDGERALSNMWTGDWSGSTFNLVLSDFDRKFREQLANNERYWTEPLTVRMTTRANRAIKGTPYTVFVGPIIEIQPERPLALNLTLGDIVSQGLLSDQALIPWRSIRDSFVMSELVTISEALDLDSPEPQIYGTHRRVPDQDPPSPQGFQIIPIYLGTEFVGNAGSPGEPDQEVHVWMVAGHACFDLPDVLVWTHDEEGGLDTSTSVTTDPDWYIPYWNGYPPYEDRRSPTFGNLRRYTLIRAKIGNADAQDVVSGAKTLACFVDGIETSGEGGVVSAGGGTLITDRIEQYLHFLQQNVVNRGPNSYQSGPWLTTPSWDLFDGAVPMIDEDSFADAVAIAQERLPSIEQSGASPTVAGYIGAAIIGARQSDRSSVRRWISDWNRSCGLQFGITHNGQIRVTMLHPTEAIKALAPLYTDVYEILKDSFELDVQWGEKVNRVPWRADYENSSGQWKTANVLTIEGAIDLYGVEIMGEVREYPFAPGETAANHLALMEARVRMHPPKIIRLEGTIGPNPVTGESLGYLDIGDYIRYKHFAAHGELEQIRLAYIQRHQVQGGRRRVMVEAMDVEELIGFDAGIVPTPISGALNDTCENALDITLDELGNYTIIINTSENNTDPSAPVLTEGNGTAYHAAWWKYTTPDYIQKGHVTTGVGTTGVTPYDTVVGFLEGECGSQSEIASNDNDGIFITSFIDIIGSGSLTLYPNTTYYFLVHGYSVEDGGGLVFTFHAEPL